MADPADAPGIRLTARFVADAAAPGEDLAPGAPAPVGDVPAEAAATQQDVTAAPASTAEVPVPEAAAVEQPSAATPRARVEQLDLSTPWVANLSTVLIAVGVLLVLLAVVSRL